MTAGCGVVLLVSVIRGWHTQGWVAVAFHTANCHMAARQQQQHGQIPGPCLTTFCPPLLACLLLHLMYCLLASGGEVLVPRKVFYDFGLSTVVRERFFTNPEWCSLRAIDRSTPGDYYTSPEAKRLHEKAGASLTDTNTSVWALGLDFCQWWKSKAHSTGFVTLRCEDIPHAHRKLAFTHILVVIPGPSEPACMDPYLENTLDAFKAFAPAQGGLSVVEHVRDNTGSISAKPPCKHKMILGAVYGDSFADCACTGGE